MPTVLRGRLKRVVSPLRVSTLARITVSVRVPSRPLPASPPSSRTLSRALSAHGSDCFSLSPGCVGSRVGRVALLVWSELLNIVPTKPALTYAVRAATAIGAATAKARTPTRRPPTTRWERVGRWRRVRWVATTTTTQSAATTTSATESRRSIAGSTPMETRASRSTRAARPRATRVRTKIPRTTVPTTRRPAAMSPAPGTIVPRTVKPTVRRKSSLRGRERRGPGGGPSAAGSAPAAPAVASSGRDQDQSDPWWSGSSGGCSSGMHTSFEGSASTRRSRSDSP